ncbi:hypothetical protein M5689_020806 [Euphorbia peplus]|nr:hypothetical protein M5689_020806 [Euphorbia peplus]
MQAMNAMKVWQKATDMQAIEARKIHKQAMDFEASKRLAIQKQQQQHQPEDDPLLTLTLATRNTNLTKPIACRRSLGCENQGKEGLRHYFVAWALKTTREELASGSSKKFNHGKFSPFCSYQEIKQSKERPKPFNLFGPPDKGYYVPPFEEWLGGLGSKHGNFGVLRHYKKDPDMKGKAKVGYDV